MLVSLLFKQNITVIYTSPFFPALKDQTNSMLHTKQSEVEECHFVFIYTFSTLENILALTLSSDIQVS